jgi:GntR family transcriptional regulator
LEINWNNKEPIYLQLRDRLVELIMDGVLLEGDALPSVRQISSEQRINPITVSKAFQILVDEELVEKKRGLGMYVLSGAKEKLSTEEKRKFLEQEWPQIAERIERLGLEVDELLGSEKNG